MVIQKDGVRLCCLFSRNKYPPVRVCVCVGLVRPTLDTLKKHDDGEPFRFRWLKEERKCCIPCCSSVDVKASKHGFTWEEICSCIGIGSIATCTSSQLPLCTQHYQLVYRMRNVRVTEEVCQICGVKREHKRGSVRKFVSCPEPKKLESYLKDTTGYASSLKEHDLVCHMCYKFFTRMLKCDVCTLSSEAIVSELQTKYTYLMRMIDEFECTTPDSYVELALHKTALHVCEGLIHDRAFLFPCGI